MRRKIPHSNSLFLAVFLLLIPYSAFASVEITEIMYDLEGSDSGREWIEITNKGGVSVDISKFKLLEAGVKHGLTPAQGGSILLPSASAVIASNPAVFLSEHPGFVKSVFKSSFSLSNTGETLTILNSVGAVEHSRTYVAEKKDTPVLKPKSKKAPKAAQNAATSTYAAAGEISTDADDLQKDSMLPWLAGLGGLVALGVAGTLLVSGRNGKKQETTTEADEFEIQ